jgi:hypothetical protein
MAARKLSFALPGALQLAGADIARRLGDGVLDDRGGEEDQRDFQNCENQQEEGRRDQGELHSCRALAVAGEGPRARPHPRAHRLCEECPRPFHGAIMTRTRLIRREKTRLTAAVQLAARRTVRSGGDRVALLRDGIEIVFLIADQRD